MHILLLGAWCALVATSGALQAAPPVSPPSITPAPGPPPSLMSPLSGEAPPDYFRIEGSTHPEQIPDHWIWRASFLKLASIKQAGREAELHPPLRLSDADAEALYKEAVEQLRRDEKCLLAMQSKRDELRAQQATPSSIERVVAEVTLDCRSQDLDAAERVLDAMSEEGRVALRAWVDAKRRNTTAFVPISDKELFRLPR